MSSFFLVLKADASRIKCHHCADADCRSDESNFGTEITCPIGVKRCMVVGNRWHDMFYRSCEWQIKDESMDQVGSEGYCAVTGDEKSMHVCTCSTEKCNTGFNGKSKLFNIMNRFLKIDNL